MSIFSSFSFVLSFFYLDPLPLLSAPQHLIFLLPICIISTFRSISFVCHFYSYFFIFCIAHLSYLSLPLLHKIFFCLSMSVFPLSCSLFCLPFYFILHLHFYPSFLFPSMQFSLLVCVSVLFLFLCSVFLFFFISYVSSFIPFFCSPSSTLPVGLIYFLPFIWFYQPFYISYLC
jgi:hypothetical protein